MARPDPPPPFATVPIDAQAEAFRSWHLREVGPITAEQSREALAHIVELVVLLCGDYVAAHDKFPPGLVRTTPRVADAQSEGAGGS